MSVWTKTKPSPTPTGPWFKAFAKKLKAWWERLFAGTRNRADSDTRGEPAGTPPTLNASADESEKGAARVGSPAEDDPLADWLALVAEGAPELLLPPEEGGVPWQRVSQVSAEISEYQ